MSTSIDQAFVADYTSDVHLVYQREGTMLRGAVFQKNDVVGSTANFHKMGTGTATTKSRHGEITPMNATHSAPSCTLVDLYAGDWVDRLDEAKTSIDTKMVYAKTGAYALGRAVDDQITTVLDTTTQSTVTLTVTSMNRIQASLLAFVEALDGNNVPNDGDRYAALTPRMWMQAMTVKSFASSDYVGANGLPFTQGAPGHRKWKDWMGTKWCMHTGLPGKGTATAKCFIWHKLAVGHATGKHAGNIAQNEAVQADVTWHGDRAAHFVNHMMSGQACMVDDTGVIEGNVDDTAAIAFLEST
jgi:hypothetical protein